MSDADLFNAVREANFVENFFLPSNRMSLEAPVLSDVVFPLCRIIRALVSEIQHLKQ